MSPNADQTRVAAAGLTSQEAQARLGQFGPNEPAATQHHSFFSDLWHAFANPLVLILVIAATVSAFTGDRVDAAIIGDHCSAQHCDRPDPELSFAAGHRKTARGGRPYGNRPARWAVERTSPARRGAGRCRPPFRWRPGSRGCASLDRARSLCATGIADGRVASRRKAGDRGGRIDQSGCAQHGLPGHVGRQRNRNRGGRGDWRPDRLWRYCGPPRRASGGDRLRSGPAQFQPSCWREPFSSWSSFCSSSASRATATRFNLCCLPLHWQWA